MFDFLETLQFMKALWAIGITFFILYLFIKSGFLYSIIDPVILSFFQIIFTIIILGFLGLLPLWQGVYFFIFILFILCINKIEVPRINFVPVDKWLKFSNIYFFLIIIINIYLIKSKGVIWDAEDFNVAKTEFYQSIGIIKRLNDIGIIILGVSSFYWFKSNKIKALIFFIITLYLIFSQGSKSGVLAYVFLYGAYIHYNEPLFKSRLIKLFLIAVFTSSSFFVFFFIWGDEAVGSFLFRFIGYADGPIYYYSGQLSGKIHRPPYYIFEQFMLNARIIKHFLTEGLGQTINYEVFNIDDPRLGPNPQMILEGEVMYGKYAVFYYLVVGFIIVLARKICSNPYSLSFACMFIGPLPLDSQYAFNNLFTVIIFVVLFLLYNLVLKMKIISEDKKNNFLRFQ